uniref:Uncharacterized protein n=1 Tax=Arundo donax TaxID=35708 RepID=A0A0A8XQE1_ARUDO
MDQPKRTLHRTWRNRNQTGYKPFTRLSCRSSWCSSWRRYLATRT